MCTPETPARPRLTRTAVVLGVLCLLWLVFLLQDSVYGDAPSMLRHMRNPDDRGHPNHLLYIPLLELFAGALSGWGLEPHRIGALLSACCTSLSIGILCLATAALPEHLGAPPIAVALAVACCPSVVFFGTTMELHAPFLLFASIAILALARLLSRPGALRAALLGACTGIAFLFHASGHLLAADLVLAFVLLGGCGPASPTRRRIAALALCALLAHVLTAELLLASLRTALGSPTSSEGALAFVLRWAEGHSYSAGVVLETVWWELVLPYLPVVLLALWPPAAGTGRRLWLVLVAALGMHLVLCLALVPAYNEHGAYQGPLAWLMAVIVMRRVGRSTRGALIAIAAALSMWQVYAHDDPEPARTFAADYTEAVGPGQSILVVGGDFREHQAVAVHLAGLQVIDIATLGLMSEAEMKTAWPAIEGAIDAALARELRVVFTSSALATLDHDEARRAGGAAWLLGRLRDRYALRKLAVRSFSGTEVRPRD